MCEKTLFDYLSTLIPIVLSALLIVQNFIINYRNKKLQKEIHNRDIRLRKHDDILNIYYTFYEFTDLLYTSNFIYEVKQGNISYVMNYRNNLMIIRYNLLKKLDLAALLFKRNDNEFYVIIEERIKLSIEIIDKYLGYIQGNFYNVATQAWEKVIRINNAIQMYNYNSLYMYEDNLIDFLKMCETPETKELDTLLYKHKEMHKYENFDIYFEKYLGMEELK